MSKRLERSARMQWGGQQMRKPVAATTMCPNCRSLDAYGTLGLGKVLFGASRAKVKCSECGYRTTIGSAYEFAVKAQTNIVMTDLGPALRKFIAYNVVRLDLDAEAMETIAARCRHLSEDMSNYSGSDLAADVADFDLRSAAWEVRGFGQRVWPHGTDLALFVFARTVLFTHTAFNTLPDRELWLAAIGLGYPESEHDTVIARQAQKLATEFNRKHNGPGALEADALVDFFAGRANFFTP